MIAGNKCWVWVLVQLSDGVMRYKLVWIFWYEFDINLMIKNYDFDRVVLFVDFVLCESIDFTDVLWDFWFVNKLV